jgi:hypothetical protein
MTKSEVPVFKTRGEEGNYTVIRKRKLGEEEVIGTVIRNMKAVERRVENAMAQRGWNVAILDDCLIMRDLGGGG